MQSFLRAQKTQTRLFRVSAAIYVLCWMSSAWMQLITRDGLHASQHTRRRRQPLPPPGMSWLDGTNNWGKYIKAGPCDVSTTDTAGPNYATFSDIRIGDIGTTSNPPSPPAPPTPPTPARAQGVTIPTK